VAIGQSAAELVSTQVLSLTEGVIRTMFWHEVKLIAVVLIALGLVGSGFGLFAGSRPSVQAGTTAQADDDAPKPEGWDRRPGTEKTVADEGRALRNARMQSIENLKLLALAMHNFHDTHGRLPAAAVYSRGGRPLLSWRVTLLPYLDQDGLYKQFHL